MPNDRLRPIHDESAALRAIDLFRRRKLLAGAVAGAVLAAGALAVVALVVPALVVLALVWAGWVAVALAWAGAGVCAVLCTGACGVALVAVLLEGGVAGWLCAAGSEVSSTSCFETA